MAVAHWVVGPQLIGLAFLIIGYLQWFFPPKSINDWYGYRSDASKKNQKTWDEGNHYAALLTINMGYITLIIGVLMAWFIPYQYQIAIVVATVFTGIGCAVILMVKTEKHLSKTFDK